MSVCSVYTTQYKRTLHVAVQCVVLLQLLVGEPPRPTDRRQRPTALSTRRLNDHYDADSTGFEGVLRSTGTAVLSGHIFTFQ